MEEEVDELEVEEEVDELEVEVEEEGRGVVYLSQQ